MSSDVPPPFADSELATRKVTDPRAMRALAHPLRLALLEALAHAGTLTATQASELLGESPATCAFHLRTLAKYGFVEEAGGGRGRERPWRRVHEAYSISSEQEGESAALAADEFGQFWLDAMLERARATLARRASWPPQWRHTGLGRSTSLAYLTPEEAREFEAGLTRLLLRHSERLDHPELRPDKAMPVEIITLSYPALHLAGRPAGEASEGPATGGPAGGKPATG